MNRLPETESVCDGQPLKRLAIVGGGSSGLITLKYALEFMPEWETVCYEKTNDITGCWGRNPKGFVSTSTKYATQFACFQKYDANVHRSANNPYADFFQDDEYGDYLEEFADAFSLKSHIMRNCEVSKIERTNEGRWRLSGVHEGQMFTDEYSHLVIATGLADQPREIQDCDLPQLRSVDKAKKVQKKTVVVFGGGESAVDVANRLSDPLLGNKVFLSLRSGVRVSPRYHPIRGVPSDFLRTRLLLSNHPDIRNLIGQKFVEFRIAFDRLLRRWFPERSGRRSDVGDKTTADRIRKEWDQRLTKSAKDQLFNVYHNKSDDFLGAVAEDRIKIVGANVDKKFHRYYQFQNKETIEISPDLLVPAIGFHSTLHRLFSGGGEISLDQFYLGCLHVELQNLGAIGFARPIIGNIPSISEMQARYVCGVMAGQFSRPDSIDLLHTSDRLRLRRQFSNLDTVSVYPVEMFPYCDQLASRMGCYPSLSRFGSLRRWCRMLLTPATTLHYFDEYLAGNISQKTQVHSPWVITALLILAKPIDFVYRALKHFLVR